MIKNYIKIAWRNITKSPFYSFVNIIGLSVGIAFTLLISAYVWNELRVNKHLKNANNQYIIQTKWKDANQGYELATFGQLAKSLKENYPNLVANYYRYDGITSNVSKGDRSFREGIQVGDSTLLSMYGFALLEGDSRIAFETPDAVVITHSAAKKYFNDKDAVGQTLTIESFSGSKKDFQVTGVLKAMTRNSVTQLVEDYPNNIFIAEKNINFFGRNMDWGNLYIANFVELKPGVNPSDLVKPISDLITKYAPLQANLATPYLTSLKEYYLDANNALVKKMLYALSGIAFFILFMAVINFVNMSVSRSASRMREIGVRKVLGGNKRQLIGQFLTESIVLVSLAGLVALGVYALVKDMFGKIIGRALFAVTDFPFAFILFLLLLIIFTGLLAGIYPAFVLSSQRSVESLKGKLIAGLENRFLRKGLVAFQFGTAAIVFTAAIIISRQVKLFFSTDLGYNKEFVLAAQVPRDWSKGGVRRMENIRHQLAQVPRVSDVSLSFEVPDGNNGGNFLVYRAGKDSTTAITSQILGTDEYYASTYQIPMAAGEFFSAPGAYIDSSRGVINETQARLLGWENPKDAIGQQLLFPGNTGAALTIAGVTKDFHFGSMQKAIQPITFLHVGNNPVFRFLSLRLRPGNISKTLDELQKKWAELMPGAPFEYKFMDDTLENLYKTEIQLERASHTATILSIVIVMLGVIGLISLSLQKRTREIGIRKVLGASIPSIISLFMKEFIWVILLGCVIACPIAWFIMQGWLSDYTYRITITVQPFVIAIGGLALITIVLIVVQTIKAGLANPVKSLRTE
jgi:ABC-type antimicrobial peptide transport system permease subunit